MSEFTSSDHCPPTTFSQHFSSERLQPATEDPMEAKINPEKDLSKPKMSYKSKLTGQFPEVLRKIFTLNNYYLMILMNFRMLIASKFSSQGMKKWQLDRNMHLILSLSYWKIDR